MAMQYLKQAKDKVLTATGLQRGLEDETLQSYKDKLNRLEAITQTLQTNFKNLADAVLKTSECADKVSDDVAKFYLQSAPRKATVDVFQLATRNLTTLANKVFKEQFGWDIMQEFDHWITETRTISNTIENVAKAKREWAALDTKVKEMQSEKEKRAAKGMKLTQAQEQLLAAEEDKLSLQASVLANMRKSLDDNVKKTLDGRFASFDRLFVRLMELQVDFYRQAMTQTETFNPSIENFRKKVPRGSERQSNGVSHETEEKPVVTTPASAKRLGGTAGSSSANDTAPSSDSKDKVAESKQAGKDGPVMSKEKRPSSLQVQEPGTGLLNPGRSVSPAPGVVQAPGSNGGNKPGTVQAPGSNPGNKQRSTTPQPEADILSLGFGIASSAGSGTQQNLTTHASLRMSSSAPEILAAKASNPKSPTSAHNTQDLFDLGSFMSSPATTSNTAASSSNNHSNITPTKDDTMGMFAPPTPTFNKPKSPLKPQQTSSSGDPFGFDMFSAASNPPKHPGPAVRQNQNSTAKGNNAHEKNSAPPLQRKESGVGDFDPFGSTPPGASPMSNGRSVANGGESKQSKADVQDSDWNLSGDGIRIDGALDEGVSATMAQQSRRTNIAYVPPSEEQRQAIQIQAAMKVEEMRAVEDQKEADREAVKAAETPELMRQLETWQGKAPNIKSLRTLLSTLHQVLWEGSGWNAVNLSELMDLNNVKKQYRKAVAMVHPDKVSGGTAQQKVIAECVFEALSSAWAKFQTEAR